MTHRPRITNGVLAVLRPNITENRPSEGPKRPTRHRGVNVSDRDRPWDGQASPCAAKAFLRVSASPGIAESRMSVGCARGSREPCDCIISFCTNYVNRGARKAAKGNVNFLFLVKQRLAAASNNPYEPPKDNDPRLPPLFERPTDARGRRSLLKRCNPLSKAGMGGFCEGYANCRNVSRETTKKHIKEKRCVERADVWPSGGLGRPHADAVDQPHGHRAPSGPLAHRLDDCFT